MTTKPAAIKQSDLLNQLVLVRDNMQELGRVEVLWMYPQAHRVLGFICKSGFLGSQKTAFKLAQIVGIGSSGVITMGKPETTDASKVQQLESLIQHEIWTESGDRLGKIIDCVFNLQTGVITQYLFISSGWRGIAGEIYQISPRWFLEFGQKRVLVSETAHQKVALYQEGIPQKLAEAGDLLKEGAEGVAYEFQAIARTTQHLTHQVREQFQDLTGHAKEQAQVLSEQAKNRAGRLSETLKQESKTWLEQAKEKSQHLAQQIKEQTQGLHQPDKTGDRPTSEQVEDIENLWDDDFDHEFATEFEDQLQSSTQKPLESPNLDDEFDDIWGEEEDSSAAVIEPEVIPPASTRPDVLLPKPTPKTVTNNDPPNSDLNDDDDEPWI
jgi:uncharacterized protein YrrD